MGQNLHRTSDEKRWHQTQWSAEEGRGGHLAPEQEEQRRSRSGGGRLQEQRRRKEESQTRKEGKEGPQEGKPLTRIGIPTEEAKEATRSASREPIEMGKAERAEARAGGLRQAHLNRVMARTPEGEEALSRTLEPRKGRGWGGRGFRIQGKGRGRFLRDFQLLNRARKGRPDASDTEEQCSGYRQSVWAQP